MYILRARWTLHNVSPESAELPARTLRALSVFPYSSSPDEKEWQRKARRQHFIAVLHHIPLCKCLGEERRYNDDDRRHLGQHFWEGH